MCFTIQLQELVEGLIEVHGVVKGRNELHCNNYILFPDMHNLGMFFTIFTIDKLHSNINQALTNRYIKFKYVFTQFLQVLQLW